MASKQPPYNEWPEVSAVRPPVYEAVRGFEARVAHESLSTVFGVKAHHRSRCGIYQPQLNEVIMAWRRVVLLIEDFVGPDTTAGWASSLGVDPKRLVLLSNKPLDSTEPDPTADDVLERIARDALK